MKITSINRAIEEQVENRKMMKLVGVQLDSYRSCIFISHKKEDESEAKEIADYILSQDIDVYFDSYDYSLNSKTREVPNLVVKAIVNALNKSSHIICILSEKTIKSWWVPYEIGFAFGKDIPNENMRTLCLKNLKSSDFPDYINIIDNIVNYNMLDSFLLNNVTRKPRLFLDHAKIAGKHPLSNIMN